MTSDAAANAKGRKVDPLLASVGARIRVARARRDLSLAEAASRTGLSKDFLSRAELGKQAITVKALAQVAAGLGTSMSEILEGVGVRSDS